MESSFLSGFTVALATCVWFIWGEARKSVKHAALRKEFGASYVLLDIFVIIVVGIVVSRMCILSEVVFDHIGLEPKNILRDIVSILAISFVMFAMALKVHGVFSKLNWAIEMDRLQKLSGLLMTSARPIDGTQSSLFSIYCDGRGEMQDFTVRDESVVKKLGMLLDQRVTVFYAAPSDRCLPVASFVAPDTAKS